MTDLTVTPASRADWRAWLQAHHADTEEAWVVFFKKGAGKDTLSYNDAVEEAICFGWVDGLKKSLDAERYMHRFTPRKPGSKWSPSNIRRVERMQAAGLMAPPGEAEVKAAKASGAWDNPTGPQTGFAMPAELDAVLKSDAGACANFDAMPPSHRRQYIDWIASAKKPETRERRAARALDMLRAGERLGMV